MNIALTIAIAWLLYAGFALCVGVYRQWLAGRLNVLNKLCFGPVIIGFYALDVLVNWTLLLIIWGKPPRGYSISERFEVYHYSIAPSQTAKAVATWVCEKLLNTIDPTGAHC